MARTRTLGLTALLILGGCASAPHPHYYANDGPPATVPPHLGQEADATPRIEPLDPYANRPYFALGRRYVPLTRDVPFRQRGIASWYGRQYQGNRTASGEPYDMFAMTAAHPTLPIPSYARVTNLRNGRSVIVRVNDRGPFLFDRVIDLSYAAATRLGIAGPGTGEVEVERITDREIADGSWKTGRPDAKLAALSPQTVTPPAPTVAAAPAGGVVPAAYSPPARSTAADSPPPATPPADDDRRNGTPTRFRRCSTQITPLPNCSRRPAARQLIGRCNSAPFPARHTPTPCATGSISCWAPRRPPRCRRRRARHASRARTASIGS